MSRPQLEKVTIRTFKGDCAELAALFPAAGYNKVIRHMIRNLIKSVKEKSQQKQQVNFETQPIDVTQILEDAKNDTSDD